MAASAGSAGELLSRLISNAAAPHRPDPIVRTIDCPTQRIASAGRPASM